MATDMPMSDRPETPHNTFQLHPWAHGHVTCHATARSSIVGAGYYLFHGEINYADQEVMI